MRELLLLPLVLPLGPSSMLSGESGGCRGDHRMASSWCTSAGGGGGSGKTSSVSSSVSVAVAVGAGGEGSSSGTAVELVFCENAGRLTGVSGMTCAVRSTDASARFDGGFGGASYDDSLCARDEVDEVELASSFAGSLQIGRASCRERVS